MGVTLEFLTANSIWLRLLEGADVALGMSMIKLAPNIRDKISEIEYNYRASMGDLRSAGGAVEALLGEELATREEETSLPGMVVEKNPKFILILMV